MIARRSRRASYGCECAGETHVGRINPQMTAGILDTIGRVTGDRQRTCPWFAFREPFVGRVLSAVKFQEHGNMSWAVPNPSHRLVCGVDHYMSADNRVQCMHDDMARAERAQGVSRGR